MRIACVFMLMLVAGGCMSKRAANPAATQPVTAVDPALAEKEYWLARPPVAEVRGAFDSLWDASEETARQFLFRIDRRDQRSGLMTTQSMISKQWWEIWRKDAGTFKDTEEATLASIRRTIFFQFKKGSDGSYTVTPKIVVERESKVDPRYKQDIEGPSTYWYALRRDEVMEKRVADAIRKQLDKAVKAQASAR
jgi:hypothetical protein